MSFNYYDDPAHAEAYNKFRPSPPQELAKRIIDYLQEKVPFPFDNAIDMGCGGGQSTEMLAPYFKTVEGFDPSEAQVAEATRKNKFHNITYRVGSAEEIDCADSSVQLVTACQASHWFDLPKFYAEVNRILVPGGVLALFGYLLPSPKHGKQRKNLDSIVKKMYCETIWDYVFPQSKMVYLDNYRGGEFNNIPFIKEPIVREEFIATLPSASVDDLVGYVSSWSGFQNMKKHLGEEKASRILGDFRSEMMDAIDSDLPPNETGLEIQFKYFLLLARKP